MSLPEPRHKEPFQNFTWEKIMTSEPWLGYSDDEPATTGEEAAAKRTVSAKRPEPARLDRRGPLAARQSTLVDFVPVEFQLN